jgi:hypothetical protein
MLLLAGMLVHPVFEWIAAEIEAMLPYCAGRFAREATSIEEYKRCEAQNGPDFLHAHHLCHGIRDAQLLSDGT